MLTMGAYVRRVLYNCKWAHIHGIGALRADDVHMMMALCSQMKARECRGHKMVPCGHGHRMADGGHMWAPYEYKMVLCDQDHMNSHDDCMSVLYGDHRTVHCVRTSAHKRVHTNVRRSAHRKVRGDHTRHRDPGENKVFKQARLQKQ